MTLSHIAEIAGVAAIPVGLAVNLYGLEHGGQTGRGEQNIRRNSVVLEHVTAAGPHIGGTYKEAGAITGADMAEVQIAHDGVKRVLPGISKRIGRIELRGDTLRRDGKEGLGCVRPGAQGRKPGLQPGDHAEIADLAYYIARFR